MLLMHVGKSNVEGRVQQIPVHCKVQDHIRTAGQAPWRADALFQQVGLVLNRQPFVLRLEDIPLHEQSVSSTAAWLCVMVWT